MAESEVRRINCTACGAPLELYGGHKVETLTCSYCGTLLDAHADFNILKRHAEDQGRRSYLPLQIGIKGQLKGVEFRVIGLISYRAEEDVWTEFCLFSPTHGYAFLAWSNGHFVFHRRERDIPVPSRSWGDLKLKQKVRLGRHSFRFYEAYTAEVLDVAGELPWRAEVGDRLRVAEAIAPPYSLSQEMEGEETEYYLGEYLDHQEVAEAFGIEPRKPSGVHPAQPFRPSELGLALKASGLLFAPLAFLVLIGLMAVGGGNQVLKQALAWEQISQPEGAQTQDFRVSNAERLVEAKFITNVSNAWMWLEISLLKDGAPLFNTGKEISYYYGREGGESWSEGSQSAKLLFKVPEPGLYRLELNAEGGGSGYRSRVYIKVSEGVLLLRWFLILLLLTLLASFVPLIRRSTLETRRWAPVAEDEDD
ncbi:MAG: DUF4178 domain-containing protein [Gammaproteobacteria bacterium SHHR-1]|uniref:DUF4178 domain-containing protein n=1 Tax=Magnetovirga frankeli TaxID=947516 RepID=UPI001292DADC|nr:DUF4178 domain-containing protein [gamma proteobacterium SS-5]